MTKAPAPLPAPLIVNRLTIPPEWIDYNGHMNVAFYVLLFDQAFDKFLESFGVGADYAQKHGLSFFIVENHVLYRHELLQDTQVSVQLHLYDLDPKRLHVLMTVTTDDAGEPAADAATESAADAATDSAADYEFVAVFVDLQRRRSTAMPGPLFRELQALHSAQHGLAVPDELGKIIGLATSRS